MSAPTGLWDRVRRQPRNVPGLGAASFFNDVSSEMIYPLLPTFLVRVLGASLPAVGLIEGTAESLNGLVKLWFGGVSDRVGRQKPLVFLGYGVAALARPLIAATGAVWQVLGLRAADRFGKGIRTAPRDALLARSAAAGSPGLAFGIQRGMDHAGAVVGPLLAAGLLLIGVRDLRVIFALSALPAALTLLIVWRLVTEISEPPERGSLPGTALAGLRSAPLRRALLVFFVFTLGNSTDAFLLLRAGDLGVATAAVPLLWSTLHASKAAWSLAGGDWADRLGARRTIGLGWAVYAGVYAGFALGSEPWHAWALFAVYGIYFGLTEAPERSLVAKLADPGRLGSAMGGYQLAVGVGALPASVLFGLLWERIGPEAAFLTGAAIAGLAAMLLFTLVPSDAGAAARGGSGRIGTDG